MTFLQKIKQMQLVWIREITLYTGSGLWMTNHHTGHVHGIINRQLGIYVIHDDYNVCNRRNKINKWLIGTKADRNPDYNSIKNYKLLKSVTWNSVLEMSSFLLIFYTTAGKQNV